MQYLLTAEQMKAADAYTIDTIGIPSCVLMDRAAHAVFHEIRGGDRYLVLCGTGNNGGDGLAVAILLAGAGHDVEVVLVGSADKMSVECKRQWDILHRLSLPNVSVM